jgi:excisionase family DNA binding protein
MAISILRRLPYCTYRNTYSQKWRPTGQLSQTRTRFDLMAWTSTSEHARSPLRTPVLILLILIPILEEESFTAVPLSIERTFFQEMSSSFETKEFSKLLYSVADAATLLSCSKNTVYNLIRSGEILAVYPTSKARISALSLARFVQLKEAEARSERSVQARMVQ